MDKFLAWFQLVMQFAPVVLQLVAAIEGAAKNIPGGIPGPVKKAVVTELITGGAAAAGTPVPPEHQAGIGTLIDATVGAFNKAGVFAKPAAQ